MSDAWLYIGMAYGLGAACLGGYLVWILRQQKGLEAMLNAWPEERPTTNDTGRQIGKDTKAEGERAPQHT